VTLDIKGEFVIAIGGGTASGKSTLAHQLVKNATQKKAGILLLDSYYRSQDHIPLEERANTNYDHPDSFEVELLLRHLSFLKSGESAEIPVYDYATHTRVDRTVEFLPRAIVIVEGILALYWEELREVSDMKIFIDAPDELRLERRIKRDIAERGRTRESVLMQWESTVVPMHNEYCEPTKRFADKVIAQDQMTDRLVEEIINEAMSD